MNVLNPKVALFMVAFLPQFIVPGDDVRRQTVLLGAVFFLLGLAMDVAYALLGGTVRRLLLRRPRLLRGQRHAVAAVYGGLACYAALAPHGG